MISCIKFRVLACVLVAMAGLTKPAKSFAQQTPGPPPEVKPNKAPATGAGKGPQSLEGQGKVIKYKEKTTVDFEDTSITGARKDPFATMLDSRNPKFNSGFMHIRREWHDKMVGSVTGLSQ